MFECSHLWAKNRKKRGGSTTFVEDGFVLQHLQPQNLGSHDFIWSKLLNVEVPLNIVFVYFASGVKPVNNERITQGLDVLEQIVLSLEQSDEPFLILDDFKCAYRNFT